MEPITLEHGTHLEPDIEDQFVEDQFIWDDNAQEPIKDIDMHTAMPKSNEAGKKIKVVEKDTTLPIQSKKIVALLTQEEIAAEVSVSTQIKQ
eukprot:2501036-Ditylum_brightwellii.AAC.1